MSVFCCSWDVCYYGLLSARVGGLLLVLMVSDENISRSLCSSKCSFFKYLRCAMLGLAPPLTLGFLAARAEAPGPAERPFPVPWSLWKFISFLVLLNWLVFLSEGCTALELDILVDEGGAAIELDLLLVGVFWLF
jgi:hypothetical protein